MAAKIITISLTKNESEKNGNIIYTATTTIFNTIWIMAMIGWLDAAMTGNIGCDAYKLSSNDNTFGCGCCCGCLGCCEGGA